MATDGGDEPLDAPADAAPELTEDGGDADPPESDAPPNADADDPLPHVPDAGAGSDAGAPRAGGGGSPDGATNHDHRGGGRKPIRIRRTSESGDDGSRSGRGGDRPQGGRGADGCCGGGCTCGAQASEERSADAGERGGANTGEGPSDGSHAVSDGGTTPANVDSGGNLRDLEFTEPAADVSQNVDDGHPDERVGAPEGAALDTPGYGIRERMNDIETPDDKTWFMELDEAVIDAGRCIQCGTCVAACPSDSIGIGEDDLPELVKMCTGCSLCWDFCPRGGLRHERQWKITGGDDNATGAGDPITEFSARVESDWRENAQDGGVVTAVLSALLEEGEIDGALVATESDEEPWKAESFLATSHEDLVENAGSFYNQTMALGNLDLARWGEKLPDKPPEELSLALVGTPCEIEGIRALQDFDWDYQSQEAMVRAVEYTVALMCTKNFNYRRLLGEQLSETRGIEPEDIGKMDVLEGEMRVYDHDHDLILAEDVANFHDAALKGCDECADFTGYCADLTVGSVGSSDEYSSVIVRTETGLAAWDLVEPTLDYHDLEDRGAVGGLQSWDKKKAIESLERPFDPDAPRFIDYTDHADQYGTETNPHERDH